MASGKGDKDTAQTYNWRQEKVFTRFCNTHLDEPKQIELGTLLNSSLDDGFRLWHILKHISAADLPKLSPPKMRIHKLQNLEICLQFLLDNNVKLVGIGPHDILDHNGKLILGLVWTIILRFQMGGTNIREAKQEIVDWAENIGSTADIKQGLDSGSMLVELVNGILPGAITDDMLTGDVETNTRLAMDTASQLLGIAQIVEAEDLLDVHKDDKVILTYLSLFKEAHEQIKLSGLALLSSEMNQHPADACAEALKKLDELTFQAHKTTAILLKTAYVSASSQIHVDIRKKDEGEVVAATEEGEKTESQKLAAAMSCDVEIEQVSESLWRVCVTPREDGRMTVDIRTGWLAENKAEPTTVQEPKTLTKIAEEEDTEDFVDEAYKVKEQERKRTVLQKEELEKLRPVKGLPHSWIVEPAPAIRLSVPKDAFVGREWRAKVECESGELPGEVIAAATLPDGSPVPVTIEGSTIVFTMPTDLDQKVSVSIYCGGQPLDGCPFVVQGKPEPRLDWIDPKTKCIERRPFAVTLKAISIPQAALNTKATQDKLAVPHVVSWKGEDTAEVSFTPLQVGNLVLFALFADTLSNVESALALEVGERARVTFECSKEGEGREPLRARAGQTYTLTLSVTNATSKDLLLLLEDQEGVEIPHTLELSEDGSQIHLSFVPQHEGRVNVFAAMKSDEIWWEEENSKTKPVQAERQPENLDEDKALDAEQELELRRQDKVQKHKQFMRDQTKTDITVNPAPYARINDWTATPISVGKTVSIPIDTNLSLDNDDDIFTIEVVRERLNVDNDGDEEMVKQVDFEFKDGVVSFTPKKPVKYFARTLLYGKPVYPHAESLVPLESLSFQAKKPTVLDLKTSHVTDPSQFQLLAKSADGSDTNCRFEVEQVGDDLWRISITPLEEGAILLDLFSGFRTESGKVKGCQVNGFPAPVSVSAAANLNLVLSSEVFTGRDFFATVECAGELPGRLTATAILADGSVVETHVEGNNIRFSVPEDSKEDITFDVKCNDISLDGTPIVLQPKPVPSLEWNLSEPDRPCVEGIPYSLALNTVSVSRKQVKFVIEDESGQVVDHEITWKQDQDGNSQAEISFVGGKAGTLKVKALFEDTIGLVEKVQSIEVIGKPTLKMQVPPESLTTGFTIGEKVSFPVLLNNMESGDFQASLSYTNGKVLPVDVVPTSDGYVRIEFMPTLQGNLSLKLEMIGQAAELAGKPDNKPVNFKVRAKPAVTFTATNEAIATFPATAQKPYALVNLNCTNISLSDLEVTAKDQTGKEIAITIDDSAIEDGSGKLNLVFTPETEGSVSIYAKLKTGDVEMAPLVIPVKPTPFAKVTKWPRSSSARVGKAISIPFDTNLDIKDDIFSIKVDEDGKPFTYTFKGNVLKFTPKKATKYTLLSTVDGKPIEGCPFTIAAKPKPKAIVVGGTTEKQALADEPFYFNFQVEGVKENKIKVIATNPEGEVIEVEAQKSKDHKGQWVGEFTPSREGKWVIGIKLNGKDSDAGFAVNVARQVKPSAKIVGVDGKCYVKRASICVIDLMVVQPSELEATVTIVEQQKMVPSKSIRKVEHFQDKSFGVKFTPQMEGRGTVEIKYKATGEHIEGSPYQIPVVGPTPWAKVDIKGKGGHAEIKQQFFWQIVTSWNVDREELDIQVKDERTKEFIQCVVSKGKQPEGEPDDSNEEDSVKNKYWDCYFWTDKMTTVFVRINLHDQAIPGSPFRLVVEDEKTQFQENDSFTKLIEQRNIDINRQTGLQVEMWWQTKANLAVPLAFTCCFLNDLGELTEIMYEGHKLSRTGAVECSRFSRKDGNVRSIFARPYTLREDVICIPIIVACLSGNFSEIAKLVFRISDKKAQKGSHYCVEPPNGKETSFLFGVIAQNPTSGLWSLDPVGKYATGRFMLDLLPHVNKQIRKYTPYKTVPPPIPLERAFLLSINPTISVLRHSSQYQWKDNAEVQTSALVYSWKNHFKFAVSNGESKKGIECSTHGKLTFYLDEIPDMVKAIVIVTTVNGETLDALSSLDAYADQLYVMPGHQFDAEKEGLVVSTPSSPVPLALREHRPSVGTTSTTNSGAPVVTKSGFLSSLRPKSISRPSAELTSSASLHTAPSARATKQLEEDEEDTPQNMAAAGAKSKSYQLAQYLGYNDDLGDAATLVHSKIIRRSRLAPWEFGIISVGVQETTISALTTQFTSANGATTDSIIPFLSHLWRPAPLHLKVTALQGMDLTPMDDTGKSDPFLEFLPQAKSPLQFEPKQTQYVAQTLSPYWGESFEFRNIKLYPEKQLLIDVVCWDFDAVGDYDYMGQFKVDIKKFYNESIKNGCRCVEKWFKLETNSEAAKNMKKGITTGIGQNYKKTKISGFVQLRFIVQ